MCSTLSFGGQGLVSCNCKGVMQLTGSQPGEAARGELFVPKPVAPERESEELLGPNCSNSVMRYVDYASPEIVLENVARQAHVRRTFSDKQPIATEVSRTAGTKAGPLSRTPPPLGSGNLAVDRGHST